MTNEKTTNDAASALSAELGVVWPAQCECGHLYLERYRLPELNANGEIGFCWCGFCRTKRMVKPLNRDPFYEDGGIGHDLAI